MATGSRSREQLERHARAIGEVGRGARPPSRKIVDATITLSGFDMWTLADQLKDLVRINTAMSQMRLTTNAERHGYEHANGVLEAVIESVVDAARAASE